MLEGFTIPAGFREVKGEELASALSLSASRSAMYFAKDDTITLTDSVLCQMRETTKDGQKTQVPVYYIVGRVNNGRPKPIPFAAFRRFPKEVDSFLEKSPLMRELYGGSDADRFDIIKGKTLKVTSLEDGETIDWQKSNLATRDFVYKPAKFPVLTEL